MAIEARLLRLRGIPRVRLITPGKRLTDARARKTWMGLYVVQSLITAGLLVLNERQVLLTLARGDFNKASVAPTFQILVFGLVAVAVAGFMLPTQPPA